MRSAPRDESGRLRLPALPRHPPPRAQLRPPAGRVVVAAGARVRAAAGREQARRAGAPPDADGARRRVAVGVAAGERRARARLSLRASARTPAITIPGPLRRPSGMHHKKGNQNEIAHKLRVRRGPFRKPDARTRQCTARKYTRTPGRGAPHRLRREACAATRTANIDFGLQRPSDS